MSETTQQPESQRDRVIRIHLEATCAWHTAMGRAAQARRELAQAETELARAANVLEQARVAVQSVLEKSV
ncbi:hypothetical protein ADP64_000067 [Achromobacter phage phiAxp-2]|uniref:Uncharacterized protein n=1 Tax=Achromobacter phage phiAxp-2 TaxID=1664246 RepID=A0A0K2FH55_9CAUD|nr:hypothetical protein ADP64_000067 [Achromobacter phage phiAxp-2]ALA45403.1 hypothetical protein ADP64_000067 [Achromobacter phage phiAxp-2]